MRYRLITFLVFGAILVGIGEWDFFNRELKPLQKLNDWWLELCVAQAPEQISDPAVTFVRITDDYVPLDLGFNDEEKEDDYDAPKKLTRLDYATILGALKKLNPKSVAFAPVPQFDEKSMFNQTDIEPLKDAVIPLPRLTLGAVVSGTGEAGGIEYPALEFEGDATGVREIKRTVNAPDRQLIVNGDAAFTYFEEDPAPSKGGIIRVPMVARQGEKVVPSFVLRALMNDAGVSIDDVKVVFSGPESTIQMKDTGSEAPSPLRVIPIDGEGMMQVPTYSGVQTKMISDRGKKSEQHHFSTLTVDQIHIPGEQNDAVAREFISKFQRELDSISKNVVVIGSDRNIDRRYRLKNGDQLSRAGLYARAIATVQSGRFIHLWPYWARCIVIVAVALFAIFVFRFQRRRALPLSVIGSLAIGVLLGFAFTSTLAWTPPFSILALLGLLIIICAILPKIDSTETVDHSHDFDDVEKSISG